MRPNRALQEIEAAALDALLERGLRLRLYLAPFVILCAVAVLVVDPAAWRTWVLSSAVTLAALRLGWQYLQIRRVGFDRAVLSSVLPVPAALLVVVVVCSGGIESPLVPIMPLIALFLSLFVRASFGFSYAGLASVALWVMTVLAASDSVASLVPEVFGGGPRAATSLTLLFTRAVVISVALTIASAVGWVVRTGYGEAVERSLHARDEVLKSHAESAQSVTLLAGEIAHELKNPLASIKGLAALLDRDLEGKSKERLTVLRREVDRMQETLESFLTFSRPLVPLQVTPIDLRDLAQEVVALHEGLARQHGSALLLEAKPTRVRADARKVKQVLINLIQNALEAAPGAAVEVRVSSDDAGATIEVMDRGSGVVDAERLFTPGVTTKPNGNGLGLTVARLVARQHGGDVRLLPREGGGAVAALSLPNERAS